MFNLNTLDESKFTPDQIQLNKDLLYDMNMGYVNVSSIKPGHGVLHYEGETEYNHPWEMSAVMEEYHFHKLHEFLTLTEYLNTPAFMIKKILKGSSKGKAARTEWDLKKAKEAEAAKKGKLPNTANGAMPEDGAEMAALLRAASGDLKDSPL